MEKRAILAIVLSLLVVVVWSIFFAPPPPVTPPPTEDPTDKTSQVPAPAGEHPAGPLVTPPDTQQLPPASSPTRTTLVTVHTGVTQLVLTSQGAGVKTVRLLEYRASVKDASPPIEITPVMEAAIAPLATDLRLGSRILPLGRAQFTPSTTTLTLSATQPEGTVVFRGQTEEGVVIERIYRFYHGSYVFDVSTQVDGITFPERSAMTLTWGPGLRTTDQEQTSGYGQTGTEYRSYISGKIVHKAPDEVGETIAEHGQVAWAALADTYFTAVLLPQGPAANAVAVHRVAEDVLEVSVQTPLQGTRAVQTMQVYVGPKEQQLLETVEASLGKLIDLGFFSPLARPMVQLLRLVNGVVHNYGVAIIVVTILIKVVFWPLTQKSYKSMKAMQTLQPKMKELQALYKDDRQGLNRAMMQLYRDQKVNPMGGCLPMLLQIPFFFAFYNALLYSIEMRHAPFICWDTELFWVGQGICDLSVYDPSYITPILMGVTMFLQQRMTPTTGDPTQAKIMQFMPLIFLFFFLKAPAGLVIYWLMNNILSIAQQLVVNRTRQQEATEAETAGTG